MPGTLQGIEACIPALRRYALALLRSRQDADDLVHDTLLRALDRLHTNREDDVRPWLFAIMHNLFVSQLRRARTRPGGPTLENVDEGALGIAGTQEDALRSRDVVRSLDLLPPEQRVVLLLISIEDLSYAETARVLGIPVGTVMSRLARGRERLRQIMRGEAPARPYLRMVK